MAGDSNLGPLDYRTTPKPTRYVEDAQETNWRYARFLYRIGLFVLLAPVTFYFAPNYFKFGKLTGLSPADFVAQIRPDDVAAVRAAKQYQLATGQLPNGVQDLIPKYLAAPPARGGDVENGQFITWGNYEHMIAYDFTPGTEGWYVKGSFANGRIPLPPVTVGQK